MWAASFVQALDRESAALAVFAFVGTLGFVVADAYYSVLYQRGVARARELEGLLDDYATRLGIDAADEEAVETFRAKLETHRVGFYRTMAPLKLSDLWDARPWPVFVVAYPLLLAAAVVAAWLYA